MIRHTVFFKLKHPPGSAQEARFIDLARALAQIQGVIGLECVRQVGRKNAYTFGLLMGFADEAAYDAYNRHPDHVRFVDEVWVPEVEQFIEIDYVAMA